MAGSSARPDRALGSRCADLAGLRTRSRAPGLRAAWLGRHARPVGDVPPRGDVRRRRAQLVPLLGRRRRLLVRPGHLDHRPHGAQRPRGQAFDQVVGVLVDRGDGAAVRPRLERPERPVVRPSCPPGERDDPTPVVTLPGVPFGGDVLLAAQAEGVRDDVGQHAGVRPVRPHRVRALGDLGRARPLQQHRVREPFDLLAGHARGRCDLVHGRSGTDTGLDLTWAQLALQLDRDLPEPGEVSPGGGAQLLVGGHREPFLAGGILEHDGKLPAALGDPDDPQRPHPRPPALFTLPVRVTVDAQPQRAAEARRTRTCRSGGQNPRRARSVPV